MPALIWAATLILVVSVDLLTGVLVGIALTALELLPHIRRLRLKVEESRHDDAHAIALDGTATFVTLPKLSDALESVPPGKRIRLDVSRLMGADHTTAAMLHEWLQRRRATGAVVEIEGDTGKVAKLAA
jgi:MFS superfamily sulfate permease-like transporter